MSGDIVKQYGNYLIRIPGQRQWEKELVMKAIIEIRTENFKK